MPYCPLLSNTHPVPIPFITSVTGNCSTVQVSVQWNTTENMGNNLPITDVSIGYEVTSVSTGMFVSVFGILHD